MHDKVLRVSLISLKREPTENFIDIQGCSDQLNCFINNKATLFYILEIRACIIAENLQQILQ
jgi:hypothetical protein